MAKVFLSHSSKDKDLVEYIAKELGFSNVVLDTISFESGKKTIEEIYRTMNDSDIFVLFLSNEALSSEWVEKEILYADGLIRNEKLSTFLPIMIDGNIDHKDKRIPLWLKKEYSLRHLSNERIIVNKIKNAIREINFKLNPINQIIDSTVVGQNELIAKEEKKFYNLDNWKPSCIIAYNIREGIGRRTVIKSLLKKVGLIREKYHPIEISISKESIESFILKLNSTILNEEIFQKDLSVIDISEKVKIAVDLVDNYANNQEILFIIDDGSIILPNTKMVDWFKDVISNERFKNRLVICLISNYRPNALELKKLNKTIDFRVEELSKSDTQSLFLKYLEIYNVVGIETDDKKFIIDKLNGIPAQIIYAANLINSIGIIETKKSIQEIIKYTDYSSSLLIDIIKKDELAYQLLLLISESPDVFTWSLIHKVFYEYDDESLNTAIQKLYDLSVFSFLYGGYEHLKLSNSLADFINRSRLNLEDKYRNILSEIIKSDLKENDLDKLYKNDYSEFLLTLQNMISDGQKVNKRYFMPSIVLKSIIKEYDRGKNDKVVALCIKLLDDSLSINNYDYQMIWELNYKLCQSLAKLCRSDEFFDRVRFFKENETEYQFLLGFYYRHSGNKPKALEAYNNVIKANPKHNRAKLEIVNIYLSQEKYIDAISDAESIYERNKNNIYNIHSYYISLIRSGKGKKKIDKVNELMDGAKKFISIKGNDMYKCMLGEYEFYINNNLTKAIELLEEAYNLNENKSYPIKALELIYKKLDMRKPLEKLKKISKKIVEDIDYLDSEI